MRSLIPVLFFLLGSAQSIAQTGYLDMHTHVAGIGAGDSGAFVGPQLRDNFRFKFYLRAMGVTLEEIEREGDQLVVQRLSERLAKSDQVAAAVVLAMDGVVDSVSGELDRERTAFYVPTEYVFAQTSRYENLLYGASVNPYRHDALQRLVQAKSNGAVLIKWLPAIMHIDPADESLIPFYEKLVELDLPLLSHAGQERAFPGVHDEFGDPLRLELPLKCGVTVIAAHIATTGEYEDEESFDRLVPLFKRYPNLYAEISSLTQLNKLGYLGRLGEIEGIEQRLLYGTDWPLTVIPGMAHPAYHVNHTGVREAWRVSQIDNPWDRDVALKQAIGVPESVFQRSGQLLLGW